jgi:hypothetical protein
MAPPLKSQEITHGTAIIDGALMRSHIPGTDARRTATAVMALR